MLLVFGFYSFINFLVKVFPSAFIFIKYIPLDNEVTSMPASVITPDIFVSRP